MRVLHVSCVAPPDVGGMGAVAAQEVALLRHRGVDAYQISLTTHGLIRIGNVGRIRSLERLMNGAQIVHLHYPFYGVAGRLAKLRTSGRISRLILTLHMDATAPGLKGKISNMHRRWWQASILDAADALVVSSKDYAEHSSYHDVVSRVIELPFGVDECRFTPGEVRRERFNVPSDAQVVGFVGGMDTAHAFKGVDVLLRALARLSRNVWGVFVGDGNCRAQYERLAQDLGIHKRILFLGQLSAASLPDVYRMCDVVACPSTSGAEAFGLVATEAMASGVPVVASLLPGVRTVVQNEVTGFLVPPKDLFALTARIQCLLDHPELRDRMGRAARLLILNHFTWHTHIDGLMQIYERLCGSPS